MFGSRATGKNHKFLALDVLIEGAKILTGKKFHEVKEAIEEARFPVKVDFVFSEDLSQSYRSRVNSDKILL